MKSIDGYLDDGIKDQSLSANPVTREMASHLDMQDSKGKEVLPKKNATGKLPLFIARAFGKISYLSHFPAAAYKAILEPHGQIVEKG